MTKAQENAINQIKKLVAKQCGEQYEIKTWEVEDCGNFVSLFVKYGMIGDEGTAAEIFARDAAHLFIGKRGGIRFPVWNQKTKTQTCRTFHGYSILEAVVRQRN